MYPRSKARSSGLDISLLGFIIAIVGFYAGRLGEMVESMPHIIRFFDVPPDHSTPGVMPQDKALLLLTDPSTTTSAPLSKSLPALPIGNVSTLIVILGVVLICAGPIWSWYQR